MTAVREAANQAVTGRTKHLKILFRPIHEVKPDPKNPRVHSKKQIRQIAASISAFGEPGGNEVPTLCLDHLTPAQARAFMIADNRLTEIATWDDRLLAEQLRDLSLLGLDFNRGHRL